MANTFSDIQQLPVRLTFPDGAKPTANPAPVSNIVITSDNPSVMSVTGPDSTSNVGVSEATLLLTALGPLGTANITVTAVNADGDSISGSASFTVIASAAKTISIVPGAPEAIAVPTTDTQTADATTTTTDGQPA